MRRVSEDPDDPERMALHLASRRARACAVPPPPPPVQPMARPLAVPPPPMKTISTHDAVRSR